MPDLGQTVSEGKVVRWLKKPGDWISKGDVLLEVETDKVTMDVESYRAGYLRSLLVREGDMASAMAPIAILTDEVDEPPSDVEAADGKDTQIPPSGAVTNGPAELLHQEENRSVETSSAKSSSRPPASPAAKALASKLNVDLGCISGSGSDGLITRRDIERVAPSKEFSKPLLPMAEITARSVQTIPHFYVSSDIDVGALLRWRQSWNNAHPDLRASVNDILVRVASLALRDVPELNVLYRDSHVERKEQADVLIVVATSEGLMLVPVADPHCLPWEEHLQQMGKVLGEARQKRGREFGTARAPALAISNLGMHGVKTFTAIIPPGATAVLSVGAVRESIVVKDRQMRFADVCSVTLASDHRVVDGVTAAKFLERMQVHLNSL